MNLRDIKPGMKVVPIDNSYAHDITNDGQTKQLYFAGTWNTPRTIMTVLLVHTGLPGGTNYKGEPQPANIILQDDKGNIRFTKAAFVVPYKNDDQLTDHFEHVRDYMDLL